MPPELLAKSRQPGRNPITLAEHSLDVAGCAVLLFGEVNNPTALGKAWCRFFRLADYNRFLLNLTVVCLFHDLGKATPGFQQALTGEGIQIFRHEYLSTFLLLETPVKRWLSSHPHVYFAGILSAVAGHHLKASSRSGQTDPNSSRYVFGEPVIDWQGYPEIHMYFDHADIQQVWQQIAKVLGCAVPLDLPGLVAWTAQDVIRLKRDFEREEYNRRKGHSRSGSNVKEDDHLIMALKSAVIVCDALGSAMPRMDEGVKTPQGWVQQFTKDCFGEQALNSDWLEDNIIQPRIRAIEATGHRYQPHDFQREAAHQPPRTLLLSGCGSGKTLAAWYWIQSQLQRFEARRIIFLYPTRATATEGFRDYVSWAGDAAGLLHGTALYDLEGMFENPVDTRNSNHYLPSEALQRLYALQHWPKKVVSATVDSFLSFMANSYTAICLLPLLADSVLVIDEVHAFDNAMFKALQEFLRSFDIPVLCMTASLPPNRQERLEVDLCLQRFPKNLEEFKSLERQMTYPRYHLDWIEAEEVQKRVLAAFKDGQRVLWVVNQVDRCQHLASVLRTHLPDNAMLCYHSRYRLCDRNQIHQDVIQRFKEKPDGEGFILVTTQVCEMSLDLDADVLVTDLAPVPSLIQRMGRCCRGTQRLENGQLGVVFVTEPEKERPYKSEELAAGRQFIMHLLSTGEKVSQLVMNTYLEQMDTNKELDRAWTAFIDGGLYSPPSSESPFRDADDFSVDAILSCDVSEYRRLRKSKDPKERAKCDGFVVPVPRYQARRNERLPQALMEADNTHYSQDFGYCTNEVTSYVQRDACLIV
jgi:CRISPR-associated endonuclease/helicase Cas3